MSVERPPLEATPLTAIAMRSVEWFERPLWQKRAFELLVGSKGAGKGTYLAGLAARISNGGLNVLFVATEDSAEIDLKPRLVAARAVMERCFLIRQHVRLPGDVDALRTLAEGLGGVGLLVVDPVANHIGDRNSNSDAEVRDAIAPLNKLADELSCLLIGVRHPGKDRTRGAVASVLGSTAWVDTPRAVVMIAKDDEDTALRHIQVVAGNRSLNGSAQAFRIEAVAVEDLAEPITLAVALGESRKSVEVLLENRSTPETRTDRARELLLDILDEEGTQESDALDARVANETGLAAKTVRNARGELKNAGLIKAYPDKDETGAILRWNVSRTAAPRPTARSYSGSGISATAPDTTNTGSGLSKPNQDGLWNGSEHPEPEPESAGDLALEDAGPPDPDDDPDHGPFPVLELDLNVTDPGHQDGHEDYDLAELERVAASEQAA